MVIYMYEIYTKEKKTFLGIKQQHISYSKYENYASDHGILKKDRRFFFTLNSRFPWLMGFFGHNSLDFDAPSLGRFTQSTFNTAMACLNTINSCSSENTWTKNLPRHRGVRESESAVKNNACALDQVCRTGLSAIQSSVTHLLHTKERKVCYCWVFFLLTIVHSWTQGETNNRLTLRCDLATQFVIPFLGHKHMKIKGPKDSDLPVRISVLTFTKYHM